MLRIYRRQKDAKLKLDEIFDNKKNILLIHYSCESFYNIDQDRTPRITSIAVEYLDTGNIVSFSIHKIAEINPTPIGFAEIDSQYNELEKQMLEEFYKFVEKHQNFIWVHWNMRSINYGFYALEHRLKVLKGSPIEISNEKTINFAKILYDLYGHDYIKDPKLYNLVQLNKLGHIDLLTGEDEAKAFEDKNYVKLHRSTLRKVDAIQNLMTLSYYNNLKTNASFIAKNGGWLMIVPYLVKEHPVVSTFITLSGWIIALYQICSTH